MANELTELEYLSAKRRHVRERIKFSEIQLKKIEQEMKKVEDGTKSLEKARNKK